MKNRFSNLDIQVEVAILSQRLCGMRIVNIYDIDTKTYLFKLARSEEKAVLLMESGIRFHSTNYDWPKSMAPSSFSMKMRKHLGNKRLEAVTQLGSDRIVDFLFGSGEAAYHVILELYDKGNIVLTDRHYTILNILRPRTDKADDIRFAVKQIYPVNVSNTNLLTTESDIRKCLENAQPTDQLKKLLVGKLTSGPAMVEHCLLEFKISANQKVKDLQLDDLTAKLLQVVQFHEKVLKEVVRADAKGYIIHKKDSPHSGDGGIFYDEFHPVLLYQFAERSFTEVAGFDEAVDQFFSQIEGHKLELKALQQERAALSKLDNIRLDHEQRLGRLKSEQEQDVVQAEAIQSNLELVEQALAVIRNAVASQLSWQEIDALLAQARAHGDRIACAIEKLKLDINHFSLLLPCRVAADECVSRSDDDSDQRSDGEEVQADRAEPSFIRVDIDLSLSAFANARRYYDQRRQAADKQHRTEEASSKAMKSAERKIADKQREVHVKVAISKTRKSFWFEKFLWFISSDRYLVIAGHDQQQNELIVRRYLRSGDLYVHADIHGATSVVIKNPTNPTAAPVPPRTLLEAGVMAVCHSAAWEARVTTGAWWVYSHQVSKTAPTGEYLSTGSFMVRGKKNFLPTCALQYGFGIIFKLDELSAQRHVEERLAAARPNYSTEASVASDQLVDNAEPTQQTEEVEEEVAVVDRAESDSDDEDQGDLGRDALAEANGPQQQPSESDEEYDENDLRIDASDQAPSSQSQISSIRLPDDERSKSNPPVDVAPSKLNSNESKRPLSAKERREQRKQRANSNQFIDSASTTDSNVVGESLKPVAGQCPSSKPPGSKPASIQQPIKRGQKAKLKKIKQKYAEQDEDERQLKMRILASAGEGGGKAKEKRRARTAGSGTSVAANKNQAPGRGKTAKAFAPRTIIVHDELDEAPPVPLVAPVPSVPPTPPAPPALDASQQPPQAATDPAVHRASDSDEDSDNADPSQLDRPTDEISSLLNLLTGRPYPDDELGFPLAVCAPYTALSDFKFKVKLLPGTNRRAKALKTALHLFINKDCSAREKELLKTLKDADLGKNCPGRTVKIMAPQMQQKR